MFSAYADAGGRGSRTAAVTGSRAGGCHKQMSSVLRLPKKKPQRAAASSRKVEVWLQGLGSPAAPGVGVGVAVRETRDLAFPGQARGPQRLWVRCSVHRTYLGLN